MRYSLEASLHELVRRGERMRRGKARRTTNVLGSLVLVLAVALTVSYANLEATRPVLARTAYGAYLLPGEAGGYVLAGTVAFVLGVVFTLLCVNHARGHGHSIPEPHPTASALSDNDKKD